MTAENLAARLRNIAEMSSLAECEGYRQGMRVRGEPPAPEELAALRDRENALAARPVRAS